MTIRLKVLPRFPANVVAGSGISIGQSGLTYTFSLDPTISATILQEVLSGLGTMSTQNASAVAITGGSITGLSAPAASSDAATKLYVDNVSAGLVVFPNVRLATAAVLPNTPTYSNGASGVGATLTAGSNTTLTVDGSVAALNDNILVKNQASAFQNGVYTVTAAGSGAAAWVLTRRTDFDTAAEMLARSSFFVSAGSTNAGSSYVLQSTVTTVGTTSATFNLFSSTSGALLAVNNLSEVSSATTSRINLYAAPFDALAYNNIALNPGHLVSQESDNTAVASGSISGLGASGFKITDCCNMNLEGGTLQMTGQRVTDAPPGFKYSVKFTVGTSQASLSTTEHIHLAIQKIEGARIAHLGFGAASPQSLSTGYWLKPSLNNQIVYICVANSDESRNYFHKFTLPQNVWTWCPFALAGCTDGTWASDNTKGMVVFVVAGSGASSFGTADTWVTGSLINCANDVTNMGAFGSATLQCIGPFLYAGTDLPTSTRTPQLVLPYDVALRQCQRQYFDISSQGVAGAPAFPGQCATSTEAIIPIVFPQEMIAVPSLVVTGSAANFKLSTAAFGASTLSATPTLFGAATTRGAMLDCLVASGLASGNATVLFSTNVAGSKIKFDARL